jgi:hypothetical protein
MVGTGPITYREFYSEPTNNPFGNDEEVVEVCTRSVYKSDNLPTKDGTKRCKKTWTEVDVILTNIMSPSVMLPSLVTGLPPRIALLNQFKPGDTGTWSLSLVRFVT